MSLFKPRRKTTRSPRMVRRNGDFQKLHIKVSSPRIVMFQVMSGLGKITKLLVVVALLGMICWGAYRGVNHLFLGNEKYKLEQISLETNGHLDELRIAQVAGIDLNASIFAINATEVSDQLRSLPEVIDCKVERRLPGTLKVTVTERVPVVWLECRDLGYPGRQDGGVLVDKDGITFPCEGNMWASSQDLPVILVRHAKEDSFIHGSKMKHPEVMRALHLINVFEAKQVRAQWQIEKVMLVNDYSLEAVCNDGTRAIFGMYHHERQLNDFVSIAEHSLKTSRMIRHINLIPEKNIPVKFVGDAVLVKPRRVPSLIHSDAREIESILERD